jgi:hypothetical protein
MDNLVAPAGARFRGGEGDRPLLQRRVDGFITEAEIHTINPVALLRVADRFSVNGAGAIIEQENHFDPRDVTNPGWSKP